MAASDGVPNIDVQDEKQMGPVDLNMELRKLLRQKMTELRGEMQNISDQMIALGSAVPEYEQLRQRYEAKKAHFEDMQSQYDDAMKRSEARVKLQKKVFELERLEFERLMAFMATKDNQQEDGMQ